MDDEVRYVESPHISNPGTPRNDDVAVVSSTSNYPAAQGYNSGNRNSIQTLVKYKTKYHADVVEWCPYAAYDDHFACGTYELQEDGSGVWLGNILLCQLDQSQSLIIRNDIDGKSGIFDLKWKPKDQGTGNLAIALADGRIELVKIDLQNCDSTVVHSLNISTDLQKKPLSLDWNYLFDQSESDRLIVSDSSGNLHYVHQQSDLQLDRTWKAHTFEAWTALFDHHDINIIYSGGDDNKLKGWDLRTALKTPVLQITEHTMGVTSMAKSKDCRNLLASGSYDERICLWDLRQLQNPLSDVRINDGGIWKLKWNPQLSSYLLAAAMHAGFHIVQLTDSQLDVADSYVEHSSLAYGVDWKRRIENKEDIVASCSFYDNSLHLWTTQLT